MILGTMPGEQSLRLGQYYGNPRNHFWRLVYALFGDGITPHAEYAERIAFVRRHGIALWDVLASCEREGSLDSRIRQEQANDFAAFFAEHPLIRHVFFNGAAAEKLFLKHAASSLGELPLTFHRLPSSSPALTVAFEQKLGAWMAVREV